MTNPAHGNAVTGHIGQLDGWRGLSILCVLAAHLLPLGPKAWQLNATAGAVGMSLFFALSGYLITTFLLRRPDDVKGFLIRRLCRILPLAWAFMAIMLLVNGGSLDACRANFLFTLNYEHEYLDGSNAALWSLCVEIHFYLFVAALAALFGRRGLYVLPVIGLTVTAARISSGTTISILTHLRVDEILAGASLALVPLDRLRGSPGWALRFIRPWVWAVLLVATSSPLTGALQYLRPYAAVLLVGSTLLQPRAWLTRQLHRPSLGYLATISFALYVWHGLITHGWLNEGDSLMKYLVKRPLGVALVFALAHASTHYWESHWIALGKWLTRRRPPAVDSSREPIGDRTPLVIAESR